MKIDKRNNQITTNINIYTNQTYIGFCSRLEAQSHIGPIKYTIYTRDYIYVLWPDENSCLNLPK